MLSDNSSMTWWQILLVGALLFLVALGDALFLRWVMKGRGRGEG